VKPGREVLGQAEAIGFQDCLEELCSSLVLQPGGGARAYTRRERLGLVERAWWPYRSGIVIVIAGVESGVAKIGGFSSAKWKTKGDVRMTIEIRVDLADDGDVDSLRLWLSDVREVRAVPEPLPSRPGEQGDPWGFLSVLCGTGGAVTVALNALTTWIESKATRVKVRIGETEVELSGPDPKALAQLIEAAGKATETGR
jgi:hypothetical protein